MSGCGHKDVINVVYGKGNFCDPCYFAMMEETKPVKVSRWHDIREHLVPKEEVYEDSEDSEWPSIIFNG